MAAVSIKLIAGGLFLTKRDHGVLMTEMPPNLTEIEGRIAVLRENIRELIEQAAAFSGAADEERVSQRIAEQEAQLELLTRQRNELLQKKS